MNAILGPMFIFYDTRISTVNDLLDDYFRVFDKKKMMEEDICYIVPVGAYGTKDRKIVFPKTGEEIYFIGINEMHKGELRGYRALVALIPEHWKDSEVVRYEIEPIMYSNFLGYYNQMIFKEKGK